MITKANLDLELQDYLASTSNIKADSNKRYRALNTAIQKLQQNNWMFSVRKTVFEYLTDLKEYNIENYLGLSDFKEPYILDGKPMLDPRRFNENAESFAYRMKNGGYYLSVNLNKGNSKLIDSLADYDNDGAWAVADDAVNLTEDSNEYKEIGSLKFNVDVSNSAENKATITNSTKSVQDLSDYEDRSYFLLWVYLPSTSITSVTLRWGSDASNYWYKTETLPVNESSLQIGWNRFVFSWEDATETGTPDDTAVDYYSISINYTASFTDTNNFRIEDLRLNTREQFDFEYFSTKMIKNTNTNVYQEEFSLDTSTESLDAPTDLKPLVAQLAFYELLRKSKNVDKYERQEAQAEIKELTDRALDKYGYTPKKGIKRINIKK